MFIKSIVLDGFKSYGNRVEITGFDPEFNVITGLNATGKSNILDSICFALGITNLSNVRAESLQELIYKDGQAGIRKATVSITFDNRDKRQCPTGYEDQDEITVTRQVGMGGKNKYLINGINVQHKQVSDLSCSVQLNANNPRFWVMQGHIAKVQNMKPPEILSMVEEATGTKMNEAKKLAAQKTKKDAKLKELNDILMEDITPKLQKLQEEHSQYQEFQKVNGELESLTKLHIAWTYTNYEIQAKKIQDEINQLKKDIETKKQSIANNQNESLDIDKKIAELNRKLEKESGSDLQRLEEKLSAADIEEVALGAELSAAKAARRDAAVRLRRLRNEVADDAAALEACRSKDVRQAPAVRDLRAAAAAAAERHAAARRRLLAAATGREPDGTSLHDRLIEAKRVASEAGTRIFASTMERKHAEDRLRSLKREWGAAELQYKRDSAGVDRVRAELERLRAELGVDACSSAAAVEQYAAAAEHLRSAQAADLRRAQAAARRARDQRNSLAVGMQRLEFRYTPPEPNFDPARVHGTLAQLIDVIDPIYCTAIETIAGDKLYNVVVDTQTTSNLLLQRGRLQRQTTIVSLDGITANVIDERTARAARDVAGGAADAVRPALDLVRCDTGVRRAVAWALGSALVCCDLDTARRVAFHPSVQRRCVTLDGDEVDPAGTLTGGAPPGTPLLHRLAELRRAEDELREANGAADAAAAVLRAADTRIAALRNYKIKSHELEVLTAWLAKTASALLRAEIEELRTKVEQCTAAIARDRSTQAAAAAEAAQLEVLVRDIKGHRERVWKRVEEEAERAAADAAQLAERSFATEQDSMALQLEQADLQRALDQSRAQVEAAEAEVAAHQAAYAQAAETHRRSKEAVKELQARVKRQRKKMASRSSDINNLVQTKEKLARADDDLELKIMETDFKVQELDGKAAKVVDKVRRLAEGAEWLEAERSTFGAAGGPYDWEARGAATAGQRAAALTARRDSLQRGLNTRAHHLLEKEERQYQEVMRKKHIVEGDRAKLVQEMEKLEEKKRVALEAAVTRVNAAFGAMSARLLPGAAARLEPAPQGLRVAVALRGAWCDDLDVLSSGQRTLVALSLVLAMLLFTPAPLYILDEVDAALYFSYTQNIGIVLKEHFRSSQIIMVTMKEGMFNNANVLFHTRCVDGMSSVQRTVYRE